MEHLIIIISSDIISTNMLFIALLTCWYQIFYAKQPLETFLMSTNYFWNNISVSSYSEMFTFFLVHANIDQYTYLISTPLILTERSKYLYKLLLASDLFSTPL